MVKHGVWTISGFETGDGNGNVADADDKSVIDVSNIGINNIADLKIWDLANTKIYNDNGTINLAGNGSVAEDENKFVIAVDVDSDGTVDAKTDIFQLAGINVNSTADIPTSISEKQLGLDLDHNGQLNSTFAIQSAATTNDLNGNTTADTYYYIDLSSAGLDSTSNANDALYLVTPNDTNAHNFDILVGVTDGSVTLNEDFFNGL